MVYIPKELKETADVSRGKKSLRQIFEYTLGIAFFCLAAYIILGLIATVIANAIPDSWESKLQRSFDSLKLDDSRLPEIEALLQQLLVDLETRELDYKVQIIASDMPNAFALPGGGIYLTTGILDIAKDDAEIAFVLAHELGHHHHRHVLKRLGRTALFRMLGQLMFGSSSFNAGNSVITLAQLGYSREHEIEADSFAQDLVLKRIPNSQEAFLILGKLGNETDGGRLSDYLSTHPNSDERIARLAGADTTHKASE